MQPAATNSYQGMLQRLSQLASGVPSVMPAAPQPPVAAYPVAYPVPVPAMGVDQLMLSPAAYPPPQIVLLPPPQAPTLAPAPSSNPLGVDWAPAPAPPAAPSNSSVGAKAVAEARKYLGIPYVWGGSTPKGFDCSGLMQYVFRSLGVSIPRVAADQFRAGREVSRNDLQPGDAVFFSNTGSRSGITHVGMYLGDGKFLHAPKTGDVVKISNLDESYYQSHYAGARRYG